MSDPSRKAFEKVTKMLGEGAGDALIQETLKEMGVDGLPTPNDRLRFARLLVAKGGLISAIGSAITVQALMQGATEGRE